MKKISNIFITLAVILSDVMCAVVAYNYCAMQWGAKYTLKESRLMQIII